MAEEVRLWRVTESDNLQEISQSCLDLELRIENWLKSDIRVLDPGLLVIGQQVETAFGGYIDLLCIDQSGDLVVVELKRDKTPREITAQVLDYGSWVRDLSNERVRSIAESFLGQGKFEEAFRTRFGQELPETLNENHRLLVVGSRIDASSERIIKYLSDTYGVNINAATFQYFKESESSQLLARIFLLEPIEVDNKSNAKGASKRRPNLSYEELIETAEQNGVGDLYRYAVAQFEPYLQKHTTRSSIGFNADLNGSRKNLISLIPLESNSSDGLRFYIYFARFCARVGFTEEQANEILPKNREPWVYSNGEGGPDWAGYKGFLANRDQIDRLTAAFAGH